MFLVLHQPGDILAFRKEGYAHYAVKGYGNDVYEVAGDDGKKNKNDTTVKKTNFGDSVIGLNALKTIVVDNALDDLYPPFPPDEIIKRAESKVGLPYNYNLAVKNCEHFAKWCRYGIEICQQLAHSHEDTNMATVGLGSLTAGPVKLEYPNAQVGIRDDDSHVGLKAQATLAAAEVGYVRAQLGLGISTGVRAGNGTIGAELLGTGISIGRETKISLFGSTFGFNF